MIAGALAIKDGNVFLLAPREGDMAAGAGEPFGLWWNDCRFLSLHELRLAGARPELLAASDAAGMTAVQELAAADRSLQLRIEWTVAAEGALRERILVRNHRREPRRAALELSLATDFLPMLELRGFTGPHERRVESDERGFRSTGRDGVPRETCVNAVPAPESSAGGRLRFELELAAGQEREIRIDFELSERAGGGPAVHRRSPEEELRVSSDDPLFDRILERSLRDLRMLRSEIGGHAYYAAGVPWFATLFGRDSLITALEMLPFAPRMAESTLRLLAANLGRELDGSRDEEPGKVIHELRVGEPATLGDTPFARYYGSVDATPLFLCLLGEHADWSGSLDLFRELRGAAESALEWIDSRGDLDGDGLVEYMPRAPGGLLTQGWKDSPDGVPDDRGEPLEAPVALVEVQGYAIRAKRQMARLFELDGDTTRAERLSAEAGTLAEALERLWLAGADSYAIGLDAAKRPGSGLTSNQGHLLWANAVGDERAARIRDALMGEELFSGWGIRTLGQSHPAYNPLGYHTGSVWPHDSALIACGLRAHGFHDDFARVFEGLLEAASRFTDHRLPELFAGFPRAELDAPVPYPVACSPQAWAAGSIPLLLSRGLGLEPDAPGGALRVVDPWLPRWVDRLELSGLELGSARVGLRFERDGDRAVLADARVEGEAEVIAGRSG